MKTIELSKEKSSSFEINKYPNRYLDFHIKKGTVVIKFTKANGTTNSEPYIENTSINKMDLISYVKFEFFSNDAIIEYKLYK